MNRPYGVITKAGNCRVCGEECRGDPCGRPLGRGMRFFAALRMTGTGDAGVNPTTASRSP